MHTVRRKGQDKFWDSAGGRETYVMPVDRLTPARNAETGQISISRMIPHCFPDKILTQDSIKGVVEKPAELEENEGSAEGSRQQKAKSAHHHHEIDSSVFCGTMMLSWRTVMGFTKAGKYSCSR